MAQSLHMKFTTGYGFGSLGSMLLNDMNTTIYAEQAVTRFVKAAYTLLLFFDLSLYPSPI